MDPLSVAASVVGLLAAGAKITTFLSNLTGNMSDAPQLAQSLVMEISGIKTAAASLQTYITGRTQISAERGSLILLEHMLTTLTGCVTTYSELHVIVADLNVDGDMSILDRLKWARHESKLAAIAQQLQNHNGASTYKYESGQSLSNKPQSVDGGRRGVHKTTFHSCGGGSQDEPRPKFEDGLESEHRGGTTASPTIQSRSRSRNSPGRIITSTVEIEFFAFERDLQRSGVYRRTINNRRSMTSRASTAMYTTAMSMFLKASLSQVSNLSFYILPVYIADLSNSFCYPIADQGRSPYPTVVTQGLRIRNTPRIPKEASPLLPPIPQLSLQQRGHQPHEHPQNTSTDGPYQVIVHHEVHSHSFSRRSEVEWEGGSSYQPRIQGELANITYRI
ncbi:hypothetical protein B0J13DRAFT_644780 [Dactylonectria estremocensis]|uniref:Fungal N-terminal domain-containing protein n=1 Tax=Dactylonectria estremocensis TaxID=1079267 RepID=A0A9P9E2E4_9HYPO|nr:hypothetical protein B0J13DRAFT_644780 [Dactylonectria estremocensis]